MTLTQRLCKEIIDNKLCKDHYGKYTVVTDSGLSDFFATSDEAISYAVGQGYSEYLVGKIQIKLANLI